MKILAFLVAIAFSFPVLAQQPKLGSEAPKAEHKKKSTKADKGNPNAKMGSQDWGRFSSNGNKSLAEQEQAKAAKKNAAKK